MVADDHTTIEEDVRHVPHVTGRTRADDVRGGFGARLGSYVAFAVASASVTAASTFISVSLRPLSIWRKS